jgi:Spy/CpxP family protein refolding chaperone
MKRTLIAAAALSMLAASTVSADPYRSTGHGHGHGHGHVHNHGHGHGHGHGSGYGSTEIDARQARQEWRIQQGVRSGQITRGEYADLEREQAYIRDLERRAKADGYLDPRERAVIHNAQDRASRHIAQETHDGDTRWNRWYRWSGWWR